MPDAGCLMRPLPMNRGWNAAFRLRSKTSATPAQDAGCRLKAAFRFTGIKREISVRGVLTPSLSPSEWERVPAGRVRGIPKGSHLFLSPEVLTASNIEHQASSDKEAAA